jgi:hypothetical protein
MFSKSSFIKREKPAKKKLTFFAFVLAMCLNQITCGPGKDTVGRTPSARTNEVSNKQESFHSKKKRISNMKYLVTADVELN